MKPRGSIFIRITCIFILQNYKCEHVCIPVSARCFPTARFGHLTLHSVAEVAKSRLLEVKDVVLDSLANAVLALDGVSGGVVSLHPAATLRAEAERRRLSQSFELRDRGCSSPTGGASRLVLRFWIKRTKNTSMYSM